MERILEFFTGGEGFFVLIILVGWLVSSLAGIMQKVAKKAAQQQQQQQRPRARPSAPPVEKVPGQMQRMDQSQGQMAATRQAPQAMSAQQAPQAQRAAQAPQARPAAPGQPRRAARRPSSGPEAEDIAREIRRLMGMEPPPGAEPEPTAQMQRPSEPEPDPHRRQHLERGRLKEEMQQRDQQTAHLGKLQDRDSRLGMDVAERQLDTVLTRRFDKENADARALRKSRKLQVGKLLDLTRPAAAILAGEVFGPPRALKGWDS